MTPPALTDVDSLVASVAAGDRTAVEVLAILRARHLTANAMALLDAVQLLRERDGFLAGWGDPYSFTGLEPDALRRVDVWQLAVDKAETEYCQCLLVLARPMVSAVAS